MYVFQSVGEAILPFAIAFMALAVGGFIFKLIIWGAP